MHELAIAEGIVSVALEKAAGRRLRRVLVRAGTTHRIVPESLESCFRVAAQETPAATATLVLEAVAGERLLVDGIELDTGWEYRPGAAPCA